MSVKLRSTVNSASIGADGFPLELGVAQAQGVTIDNYSGFWLQVGSGPLFVPPYTIGWASNMYGTVAGSIIIRKNTPTASLVNPAAGTQEGAIVAALYEEAIGPSGGYPVINKPQRCGILTASGVGAGAIGNLFITAEALQLMTVSISTSTAGVTGELYLFVQENTGPGFSDLYQGYFEAGAPLNITMPYVPSFTPAQFTGDTIWRFSGQIANRVGVGVYHYAITYYTIGQ